MPDSSIRTQASTPRATPICTRLRCQLRVRARLPCVIRMCIALNSSVMSSHPPRSSVPLAQPIGRALESSPALARLGERLRESNARFAAVRDALPEGLRAHVRPGPVDEAGWSLLAANAAVAAKL